MNLLEGSDNGDKVPLLPRDIFSSKLSYRITTHKVSSFILGSEMLFISVLFFTVVRSQDGRIGLLILGSLLILFTWVIVFLATRDSGFTKANQLSFLREVTIVKPGLDTKKWDTIASRLNPVFYENCASATPYFFYDGEACSSVFTRYFLTSYYADKSWNERVKGQSVETNGEQAASGESQVAPAHQRWNAYSELSPFIEEAVTAYQGSLETRWNEMMNGSSSV